MIKRMISGFFYRLYINHVRRKNLKGLSTGNDCKDLFKVYEEFCNENKEIEYNVLINDISLASRLSHKYVGGVYVNNSLVFVPNKESSVLILDDSGIHKIGDLSDSDYKWTGEVLYNKAVYFLPRKASNLLVLEDNSLREIQGLDYGREHHYGGIRYHHLIIQPPRSSSHFLIWDLEKEKSYKVKIGPECLAVFFRYNCSVLHPNGFVYFFPENGRVIKFDPQSLSFSFVGNWVYTMIFDAKVLPDGNIYGFSTNNAGILKFDVKTETIEILHKNQKIGAYGTKLGLNGKIYSIPGSGSCIWEFDYRNSGLKIIKDLNDNGYAKFAGGSTTHDGKIYAVPSFANVLLEMIPTKVVDIPNNIYSHFWSDCY